VADGANIFVTDVMAAYAAAEAKLAQALSSVPDHARAHMNLGLIKVLTRRATEGIAECEHALKLDRNLAHAHSNIAWFRRSVEANRNFPAPNLNLATAFALLGRLDEAHAAVKAGLALNPSQSTSRVRAAWTARSDDPTFLAGAERILEGMRKAGVPEQ
jgi:tetratricopeptide (TPR) repeat protein